MGSTVSKSWLRTCAALVAAMLVALGVALAAAPAQAHADLVAADAPDAAAAAEPVVVALTIVDEQDNKVVCNEKVDGLTTDNTVTDLLAKAGYAKVDAYAGDEKTYVATNNSPYFLGKEYNATTGAFWATIFNGSSNGYADAFLDSKLKDGGHYQYIYTNRMDMTTFEYTEAIPDPLAVVNVALTVVDELSDTVVYNGKVVGLMAGDTVADLLAAAGYTKVDSYAGDPMTYEESYGAPYFLGKGYNPETWDYWVSFYNGVIDDGTKAALATKLTDGGHYQYAYGQYRDNYVYTETIPDPLATEVPKAVQLLNNLTKRFAKDGKDGTLDKRTYGAAIGLGHYKKGYLADKQSLVSAATADNEAGAVAKYALALMSVDADEEAKAQIARIDKELPAVTDFYSQVIVAPAYAISAVTPTNESYGNLVSDILKQQREDGLFPNNDFADAQATAQAIFALAPYLGKDASEGLKAALVKARAAAVAKIDPKTGVVLPPAQWSSATVDIDTMGEMIDSLAYYNLATSEKAGTEITALANAIVNYADPTLDGFENVGLFDEKMSAATAFRGLAAAWSTGWNRMYLDNAIDLRPSVAGAVVEDIAAQAFTGAAIEPALTVKLGSKTLVVGTDYDVAYANNTNAGTATATVTGKGAFTGKIEKSFVINAAPISNATAGKIANATYTGKAIEPAVTLTLNGAKLVSGADFTVAYAKNTNVGTATATVTGKGNFTGTTAINFTIDKAAISKAKVTKIKTQKLKKKGKAVTPAVTVKFNGTKLKKGTDYTVKYKNNKKPGKATATITGKGNFKGTTSAKFKIVKK